MCRKIKVSPILRFNLFNFPMEENFQFVIKDTNIIDKKLNLVK